jgi:hypothetical protein
VAHLAGKQLRGLRMKSNLKWYVTRAVMFLGSAALAAGFFADRSIRW